VKHSKLLLSPLQKRSLYGTTGLLWLSGAVWLYLDEINPLKLWMKLHGAAAMIFLMVFGSLLFHHVPNGWKQDRQRPSGVPLIVLCGILTITGWGLYYWASEAIRRWTSLLHTAVGLFLPVIISLHVWLGRRSSAL
jgi:EamA domain-containing membrane protein RarD